MASRYQRVQLPALPPATSRTARRCGSKMNRIRISVRPAEPGRSFFEVVQAGPRDPVRRRAAKCRAALGKQLDRVPDEAGAEVVEGQIPVVDLGDQDDLPVQSPIITWGLSQGG